MYATVTTTVTSTVTTTVTAANRRKIVALV